jgi:hypothetical protein
MMHCLSNAEATHSRQLLSLQHTVGDRLTNSPDNEHFREGFLCSDNEHPWAYYAARQIA